MDRNELPKTLVETVVARLQDDMHQRKLRPGDRYMTAAEASTWLSASPVTVNRAMQMLANQNLLVRRRSRGTFVGPEFRPQGEEPRWMDVLHVVMAMDYHETRTTDSDQLVDAAQAALPGVTVEIHYIPDVDSFHNTQRVIDRLSQSEAVEGVVLIRCSRDVQKMVEESGLAAVVYGQVYPGVSLSCVCHDQESVGRLMAEHALAEGHRRFALLAHNRWTHGDNLMVAGLTRTLSQAGIALDDLHIRSVHKNQEVLAATVDECLSDDLPPTVFFCRSNSYAQGVWELVRERKLQESIRVIGAGHGLPGESQSFVNVVSQWSLELQMKHLVELIENRVRQISTSEDGLGDDNGSGNGNLCEQVMVPVRLKLMGE